MSFFSGLSIMDIDSLAFDASVQVSISQQGAIRASGGTGRGPVSSTGNGATPASARDGSTSVLVVLPDGRVVITLRQNVGWMVDRLNAGDDLGWNTPPAPAGDESGPDGLPAAAPRDLKQEQHDYALALARLSLTLSRIYLPPNVIALFGTDAADFIFPGPKPGPDGTFTVAMHSGFWIQTSPKGAPVSGVSLTAGEVLMLMREAGYAGGSIWLESCSTALEGSGQALATAAQNYVYSPTNWIYPTTGFIGKPGDLATHIPAGVMVPMVPAQWQQRP
jgi:hypothetical protein